MIQREQALPTADDIAALVAFLPRLCAPDFQPIVRWGGGTKDQDGVMTLPWPEYDPLVREFVAMASQPCWCDYDYLAKNPGEMLRDETLVRNASLEQIKTMLTYCIRGERFCTGFWGTMFGHGHAAQLLERLIALQNIDQVDEIAFFDPRDPETGYLCNFYRAAFTLAGAEWPSVEHYYQAMKFSEPAYRERIRLASTPREAKNLGQSRDVPLRSDWETGKLEVMQQAVAAKFLAQANHALRQRLLATGKARLIEASPTDSYWGIGSDGKGLNHLGRILMELRDTLACKSLEETTIEEVRMTPSLQERYRGCLLGLACGDAVGTAVEFRSRGSFAPLTDMIGGGPFGLEPGQWTDDTSMALCLAESLINKGGFDANDQMGRYLNWWQWGYLSSTGECFDIGATVRQALMQYQQTGNPFAGSTDPQTAGNGSLMRLAPVPLFYYPDIAQVIKFSAESSRTTHAAPEAIECCQLFGEILANALQGKPKASLLHIEGSILNEPKVADIAKGQYLGKSRAEIFGTGYSVACLEAALWCFHHTETFESAVLEAANLGDDADTTAAIVGQLAGTYYGVGGIPKRWLTKLHMRDEIEAIADALFHVASSR